MQANETKRRSFLIAATVIVAVWAAAGLLTAANYVNWKGGFWFAIPEGWEKVDYMVVDRLLSTVDNSRDVFGYEAVFAPKSSVVFVEEAYVVVTFDSTGSLTEKASDSLLNEIARSYGSDVYQSKVVERMSDLVPGQPSIDRARKAVSVLTEMAYRPEAKRKLWLYMRLNDVGLISLYFYSPDSTFAANRPIFAQITESLSFNDLRGAAGAETAVFTDVGGDKVEASQPTQSDSLGGETAATSSGGGIMRLLPYVVIAVVIVALSWRWLRRTGKKG